MPWRSAAGTGQIGRRGERRGVVLEPGEAPRAVHPEAAQESDLADRRADVRGQARAGGEHQQHVARRRAEARRHEHDRADVGRRRRPPRPACATAPSPSGPPTTGAYPRSHASRRCADQAVADAGDAHFLARRRRRRDREEVAGQAVGLRGALLGGALDGGPPRRREHGRQREDGEQHERRMDRRQQRDRHAEPQDPAAGREQRHVHVIEHEHLIAQHREPIEVVGALVVRDGRDRRLQPGDVRFERDRHLVAEAPLHARADRAQEPRRRGRHAEADGRRAHEAGPLLEHALAEQHQPQREQRIGQRGELRQHERGEHQPRLVAVAELAQPPHRRQRRRQRVDRPRPSRRRSGEDVIGRPLLVLGRAEALRLQIEHRAVAAALRHQLVVRAELDDAAVLEHADAVGVAHRGEAVRDEDRRAVARGGEDAVEDLRFAAHVELRGRLVEQHDAGAELHGAQRARERDALPLAAREIGAAVVAAGQHRVEARRGSRRPADSSAARTTSSGAPAGATLSRSGSSKRMKSWKTAVTRARHDVERQVAQIDAVDLDRARLRVVQPAQQLGERRLAGAVLPDDGERRAGGDREIEAVEDGRAARIREREIAEADLARRHARRPGRVARAASAPAGAIAGSRRSTAATGAAAPSSAQLSPPNAIIDVPTALCANTTTCAEAQAAVAGGAGERPEHDDVGADDEQQAPEHRLLAQPRRLVLQRVQARAAGDEAIDRPVGEAEEPQLLRGRRIDGEPDRRSRRRAARPRTSSVLRSRQTALSRSSQCVASQAPPSTSGAHQA